MSPDTRDAPSSAVTLEGQGRANPATVEVTRGGVVESRHRGSIAIVDASGGLRSAWGDVKQPVFPRSAIKALQALALVESGAADAIGMTEAELALACASHGGEKRHVETAAGVLARLGLDESALECGPHWPSHAESARALAARAEEPTQLHNNCSGKHAGMLALARHIGAPVRGYTEPTHPVQQRILGAIEQMTGLDLGQAARAVDGCSVPTWAVPLENLAYAFARLAHPDDLAEARRAAIRRIRDAVRADPFMVAGTGRYCTEAMTLLGGRAFLKTGAEGVFCAAVPELEVGVALKCDDGATRASEAMMTAVLDHLGLIDAAARPGFEKFLSPPLYNWRGVHVGDIRLASGLPGF